MCSVSVQTENKTEAPVKVDSMTTLVQTDVQGIEIGSADKDWSEVFWKRKRDKIINGQSVKSVDQLQEAV